MISIGYVDLDPCGKMTTHKNIFKKIQFKVLKSFREAKEE
jgi:hypothetical protein